MIHWNVSPEIFELGPLRVRWYGLMFLTGFSLGYQGMKKICQWEGLPVEKLDSLLVHLVLGTTIGARLGHCLFYDPVYYLSNPLEILKIWEGGLASHGGGVGVIIATWMFMRKNPEFHLWWLLDRLAIFTVMTGGFIRIGNLMNSEILGKPTDGTWGVIFERVNQVPRHPAQVYESLCYFVIFAISYWVYLKFKEKTPQGLIFGFVLAAIFTCRFFIEFVKEIQSPFEQDMIINMGQMLSIPFVAFGLFFMLRALRVIKQRA
ncbi:MAG: prolipoprotein diacylglyceryl transferase [Bdellovibrio sp. CG10_big_fil_rev_8_21_14_0_10_47_8]|nr:MAG: prolipoprotein diacylglyceryl transferase [Bdellovibrio sp. CG10_big_fil_rev_8_21_14_0_10_47_8]